MERRSRLAVVGIGVGIGGCVVLGAVLRLWMVSHTSVHSDSAYVGIMGQDILHGRFFTFYFGQEYGGVEPYVVALLLALVPDKALAVNGTPVLLAAISAVVVGRLTVEITGRRSLGVIAAALCWIWPEVNLWNSTREFGFRGVTQLCGLLVLYLAVTIVREPGSVRRWAGLGIAGGVGFWSSPEIVYFAAPVVLVLAKLVIEQRRRGAAFWGTRVGVAGAGLTVGALPWLYTNLATGFASLDTGGPAGSTYGERLGVFFTKVLPMVLGLRVEGDGSWVGGRAFGGVAYAVLLVVLAGALVAVTVRVPRAQAPALFVILFPLIYAWFPPTAFWNDSRFAYYLPPVIVLVACCGLQAIRFSGRPIVAAATVLAFGLAITSTLVSFDRTFGHPLGAPAELLDLAPDGNEPLERTIDALRRAGVKRAYADYWIAGSVSLLSERDVVVASLGPRRWDDGERMVRDSALPAWLFVDPAQLGAAIGQFQQPSFSPEIAKLLEHLEAEAVPYRRFTAGLLEVVVPARAIRPSELGL